MAGLENYPIYSHDTKGDWEAPLQMRTSSMRLRPSELNLQPVISGPKIAEDGLTAEEEALVRKYVGVSVSLATLVTENLLSHPFVVLRRQCQVHHNSRKNHLLAVTLIPVVVRLHQRQGLTTLWKGLGSTLLVRGMTLAAEDLISKFTPWPNVSLAIMTPFYSASLVETVQSDIASEKPGVFDVFKDGMCRLVSWGSPQKGRMLPVWALVVPTVIYGLLKYLLTVVVQHVASYVLHLRKTNHQKKTGAVQKDLNLSVGQDIEETSAFIGIVTADIICYPLETILHRLHLQGTRTIVDNLDSGMEVIPILTNYEGPGDCYDNTLAEEGVCGLYKGFGALILQFAAHWAVVKITKIVVTEISILLRPSPKTKPPEPEMETRSVLGQSSKSTTPYQCPTGYASPVYGTCYPNISP